MSRATLDTTGTEKTKWPSACVKSKGLMLRLPTVSNEIPIWELGVEDHESQPQRENSGGGSPSRRHGCS